MATRTRHPYGGHRQQFGELHLPPAADAPPPVAVLIHGGFWRARYNLDLMDGLAADLVARGWAAWNLEYRRVGVRSGGGFPTTLEDVAVGIDHLRALDAPLDLDRVVAIGHSAGGHLALWAAGRGGGAVTLAGAVGQAAVSDLAAGSEARLGAGIVTKFMGGTPDDVPDAYAAASPIARVPSGVPTLLVHGERDDVVPAWMSRDYAAAARDTGDEVALVAFPEDGHMEHIDPASAAWAAVVAWLGRFTP